MQFGDKDIMTDLLMGTKYISGSYHKAVLESANDRIRNTLIQLNNDEINLQKQIFNLMHDRNWYEVRPANTAGWQARPGMGAMGMQQQMPY
ncbi:spore coat protein [Desulfoscipio geothermicus]|uniref:Coat F domain-containing protein n=1 Tax=Desulfoscipio geothermicus DSM 3669 TaxID=1121426 RepID=A0A1I6D133_9FIRM|nr:spore coat protein [Desulfoscipio geothermicus]SFQ99218.1 Coat F domain-containing protein [Desulfoscipio geothermicus DSM 3669]